MAVRGLNNASRPLVALSALAVLAGCARAGADAPVTAPETSTPTPTLAAPAASARQAAQRQAKIEQALAGQQYLDDPAGQWAISATASSTYATALAGHDGRWTPEAATGAPDAESVRYPEKGWAPEQASGKRRAPEWLELRYDTAVSASAVRVRQVGLPGRLRRIELIDQTGARHVVWNGPDRTPRDAQQITWFQARFAPTPYQTRAVRLTVTPGAPTGSIDAVQLVGAHP
ncbi:hypothetical protein MWN52_01675 [Pseudoxanthomonas winnipegensis]|uniref:hypothetical protein n=1 Tax=Pseudoxanthomonas winnipegensis TaxID=2480810 RepID=UPI0025758667|nr:hypothetical protein [Pseudoxanthomonas winnipegensis]WJI16041.1 hypothetical protein MWN52_01675 [Pseudoxanthomonas winnipegensis]